MAAIEKPPTRLSPPQPTTLRNDAQLGLSADCWDTHVHVFDSSIGPFAPSRSYTPAQAPLQKLLEFGSSLTEGQPPNVVLVQPSPYRTDNTVLLHLLRKLRDGGFESARGIAVVDIDNTSDEEFRSMHELGVRGLRINMQADGRSTDIDALRKVVVRTASRINSLPGWKIQLFCAASTWDDLFDTISNLPVEVVVDHVGGLRGASRLESNRDNSDARDPTKQAGFDSIVRLAQNSKIFIKLSGLYRLSHRKESAYDDLEPIIRTLAETVPDRLVWGSDWPHTGEGPDRLKRGLDSIEPFSEIDDKQVLRNLRKWIGSEEIWKKIMVANPKRVYA